ncbi:MAG: hypothetical protein EBR15_01840 [Gammaproteobacteria bacterium]|jgi:hypothetical protein|nr:hypothetical protein [Gammaproteobacteria bacterium]
MPRKKKSATDPLALSRTALEDFAQCPRCFYLHRSQDLKGLRRIPLTLAVATDALLKNEFDAIRSSGASHPIWERENLDVRAYAHPELDLWRSNFKGLRVTHAATGAVIFGAVDDIWQNRSTGELHIVDYKSTSKQGTPDLEGGFGAGYKRQMEIYQWLFRHAGFAVSPIGYFLYVNGRKDGGFYEQGVGCMRFDTTVIPYEGDDGWVDGHVAAAVECHRSSVLPESNVECDVCRYVAARGGLTT